MKSITIVTGPWNLNYDPLSDNLNKSYCSDREKFKELLKCDNNMCIYIDPSDEEFIWDYRSKSNTKIFLKKTDEFKSWFEFYLLVQKIRENTKWCNQTQQLSNILNTNCKNIFEVLNCK